MGQIRGIILEGHSNAGKTSVLKALKKLQASDDSERSVVLGEHYSQILNNVNGELVSLNRSEHLQLLNERVVMLEQLHNWAEKLGEASRQSRGLFFVLERFHLNHRVAFRNEDFSELISLEQRLANLGAKAILLTISSLGIEQRIQSRNPSYWTDKSNEYISQQCNELLTSQEHREEAMKSDVPTLEINTDNKDWDTYARQMLQTLD